MSTQDLKDFVDAGWAAFDERTRKKQAEINLYYNKVITATGFPDTNNRHKMSE